MLFGFKPVEGFESRARPLIVRLAWIVDLAKLIGVNEPFLARDSIAF
jgi:hypothetical protein